jgi:peroxiredoxin
MHKLTALLAGVALVAAAGCERHPAGTHATTDRAAATAKAPAGAPAGSKLGVGDEAPDFEVTTTDGKKFKLSDQRGKVVLVNFFATWCVPCLTEMPRLQKDVYEKVKGDGFVLIAVGREHDNAEVAKFKDKHKFTFPTAGDPKRAVFDLYANKGIPRTVLIGRDGKVLFQSTGYSDKDFKEMLSLIRAKLEERPR